MASSAAPGKYTGENLTLDVEIPVNTTCTIYIPGSDAGQITEGGKPLSQVKEIRIDGTEDGYVIVKVGSGKYRFVR